MTDEQASLLIATNRIEGRVTASQMAAASAASVFPRFHVRLHIGWQHEPDVVSHLLKPPSPIVSTSASLQANEASWALLEKRKQLAAAKLAAYKNPTVLVYTMDLEDALCEVDANCGKF